MRLVISFFLSLLIVFSSIAAPIASQDEAQIKQELKQLESSKNPKDAEIAQALQGALNWLSESNDSNSKAKSYQEAIDNFPKIIKGIRQSLLNESDEPAPIPSGISLSELEQRIIQLSSQLLDQGRLMQQEQDKGREIIESLNALPQQLSEARRMLGEASSRFQSLGTPSTPLAEAQYTLAQAEVSARKAIVNELEMAQLSANNRQEISRMTLELNKKRYQRLELELQQLRDFQNTQRQQKAILALEHTEMLAEQGELTPYLKEQLDINRKMSQELTEQAQRMSTITTSQAEISTSIRDARQALTTIREQAQWISSSSTLGEALRSQLSRLPEMPKSQQLDREMADLRVQRLNYEDTLERLSKLDISAQETENALNPAQTQVYQSLIKTRKELLSSLISGFDTEMLELTKLNVATGQLADALKEVKDASNRYLFWVADVPPISINYPVLLVTDITQLLSLDTLSQLARALKVMATTQDSFLYLLGSVILVIFSISTRKHYQAFLDRSSLRIGKVTQDRFYLTIRTIFWSIIVALPLPMMWSAIGYGLQSAWQYPMAVAIGYGVSATTPLLWLFMISETFSRPTGLFIAHFGWDKDAVKRAMRHYRLAIFVIVPLVMALITFEHYSDREFAATLGRFCFLVLCVALSLITNNLRRSQIPLYLDRHGSGENIINTALWLLIFLAPIVAAFFSVLGYFSTSQALLARLETSVAIWFVILIIYHTIRRWMSMQRRKLAFERAKQRRAEMLAQRAKGEDDNQLPNASNEGNIDIEEQVIDLDAISTQSVGLVRSILTMIALVSLIWLWSELHTAFSFLENIRLWDVTSTINGVDTIQPITMGSIFIAILIIIVTAQLVRNLPALLELAVLQHLDLTPGTGYAISTLTKYTITIIGIIFGFSMLGIDWSKLQWLIAAMGVGLGFGLQEIFANIISGLMILFEKPIRIGDTVTIRNLTGSITKINTRATTLTDWDRKEIIVPNKAFITEQFINWSLSDTVTRIVMTIPAPTDANSELITNTILRAAERSTMILDNPAPEVYLVDLQQGIQIFELRVYAAEMGHRLPARHEIHQNILASFAEQGITLPFPPFQARVDVRDNTLQSATNNLSGRNPTRKSGEL
ncbi:MULTISPECIES: miniconductance mechanosensitive channel MscM [Providencia]|uniref:Potassium efflux system protein/small-conductance mechanosensitive channel n=1 Tax=Providencia heimbachae ATCC 35613 TaxID=1354272 RepID=A0A1B7JVE0_9GAMM|nr:MULTISPECIES: miniconductance mechanosensitive channel MscM [Providencia]MBP6123476.1 miniconductance mechanosensitive channel MscM [Providencia sp.]NIH24295.1 miniconductance mechanosensitive channel MscM [Providencia heimbachae]OAT51870.1 potassium efflux system protein/small-conductance mechanosensitive channel [Providencia heimbachae ATCC 35613]SQH15485.1 Potassium efflux system KefA precursor [Providencia heimbachae]